MCLCRVSGQAPCAQTMDESFSVLHYNGTSWTCCDSNTCIQTAVTGGCYHPFSGLTQCVVADMAKGCGINSNPGCGAYVGPIGTYGVESYVGNGLASLDLTGIGESILMNWPRVGYDNSVSLCCAIASCRLVSVSFIDVDVCTSSEYMLKCAGDNVHGICSVWNTVEIGEYLLVNANASVTSASAAPYTSTSQTSYTSSSQATHNPPPSVPIIIGVVVGVVGLVLLATFLVCCSRYRRSHALLDPGGDVIQHEGEIRERTSEPPGARSATTYLSESYVSPDNQNAYQTAVPTTRVTRWPPRASSTSLQPISTSTIGPQDMGSPSMSTNSAHDTGAVPSDSLVIEMAQMREEMNRLRQIIQIGEEPPPGYNLNLT